MGRAPTGQTLDPFFHFLSMYDPIGPLVVY